MTTDTETLTPLAEDAEDTTPEPVEPEPSQPPTADDIPIDPPDPAEQAARLAKSNRKISYSCTKCGREVGKDNLKVKRVQFKEMGVHGRIEKSRVVAWLCIVPNGKNPSCLDQDEAWATRPLASSPGMADTKLARGEL